MDRFEIASVSPCLINTVGAKQHVVIFCHNTICSSRKIYKQLRFNFVVSEACGWTNFDACVVCGWRTSLSVGFSFEYSGGGGSFFLLVLSRITGCFRGILLPVRLKSITVLMYWPHQHGGLCWVLFQSLSSACSGRTSAGINFMKIDTTQSTLHMFSDGQSKLTVFCIFEIDWLWET